MNNETIKQMGTDYIMSTYLRHDLALVRVKVVMFGMPRVTNIWIW